MWLCRSAESFLWTFCIHRFPAWKKLMPHFMLLLFSNYACIQESNIMLEINFIRMSRRFLSAHLIVCVLKRTHSLLDAVFQGFFWRILFLSPKPGFHIMICVSITLKKQSYIDSESPQLCFLYGKRAFCRFCSWKVERDSLELSSCKATSIWIKHLFYFRDVLPSPESL